MAGRTVEITPSAVRVWPGVVAAALVAAVILAALVAVLLRAETGRGLGASDWAAVRFTLAQALTSAVLSCLLAIPLARALARRSFPGRGAMITLLGAPFLLPVIVAVLGLLAIFGRAGWANMALGALGLPPVSIYGFQGVVLAHVFFNLPLATRLVLQGWHDIPAEHFRLAAQLGLSRMQLARLIEWPMLARVVPGAMALVFVLCLTSFAVALLLGGGPRATTIELAIYQAFRFDFDLGRAALLAILQLALGLGAAIAFLRILPKVETGRGLDRPQARWDAAPWDFPVIALGALFLLAPMLSILATGLAGLPQMPFAVWKAAAVSVQVALLSAVVLTVLSLPVAALAARAGGAEAAGLLGLATSPLMIGTGVFLLVFPWVEPARLMIPATALVNAIMALPFALRILVPGLRAALEGYGRLGQSLGLRGWAFWRIVLLPRLRRPLGFALGLGAALSMGDLGIVVLFADPEIATLPLQIERLLGAYRTQAAAGASLLLAAASFAIFALFDLWGRGGGARHA